MHTNYDLMEYKVALPEVTLLQDSCEVKLYFIGKHPEIQIQLAVISCEFTSLKQQVFEVPLQPDLICVDSHARIAAQGSFDRPAGLGLVGAKIKVVIADLLKKQQAEIYFKRGADRKWALEGIDVTENVQIDRSALREKRRKLRRTIGDLR